MDDRTHHDTEHRETGDSGPAEEAWDALQSELLTSDREACAGFAAMLPVWPPALRARAGERRR